MCYCVYLSTDLTADLASFSSEHLRPKLAEPDDISLLGSIFSHPRIWLLDSKTGCGCEFRHLMPENVQDLGFADPEEWFKETPDQIEGTKQLYNLLKWILAQGGQIELVDMWNGADVSNLERLDVSLNKVSETQFRLFENHFFKISL